MVDDTPQPVRLDLKKDQRLRVDWSDGRVSDFPVGYLRRMCPCAACRLVREGRDPHQLMRPATPEEQAEKPKKLLLSVLGRSFVEEAAPVVVTSAAPVGNYAIKLEFSDGHSSGIFSWAYLDELTRR